MGKITRQELSENLNNEIDTIQEDIDTLDTNLNLVQLELWKSIYPVGSLYETTSQDFNPNTHFGGTWSLYGAGRVTVGYSSGETEFNAAGKTGGSKTHILTKEQLPEHNHSTFQSSLGQVLTTASGAGQAGYAGVTSNSGNSSHPYSTANTGAGDAHNNLQPYITVFRWHRTA